MESSSSSSKAKRSEGGFVDLGILDGDSGWEVSHQLELFKVEIVTVCKSTLLIGKLDLLLHLVLSR